MRTTVTADQIDAWLPQTQCTQCGYPRCRAYAEAVVRGEIDINRCPPGGEVTIAALARLLDVASKPLDACLTHKPRARAVIDEALCIGCRKCLDVCPVDAIIGARKLMHTVIAAECTGCELCLPPCPVDCIVMAPVTPLAGDTWPEYTRAEAEHWRTRTERRLERLARRKPARRPAATESAPVLPTDRERIRAEIRAAVERVRRKRNEQKHTR